MASEANKAYSLLASSSGAESVVVSPPERLPTSDDVASLAFLVSLQYGYAAEDPKELQFMEDLLTWSERWGTEAVVEIMVMLPDDYPKRPPEVRMLRPLLEHGTGGMVNGFFVGVPQLYPSGWNPYCGLPMVVRWIRDCLRAHGARVNLETNAFYSLQAYTATRQLVLSSPAPHLKHKSDFVRRKYTAYSGSFAEYVMQCSMRDDFHYGNKILLPSSCLELLMRSELSNATPVAGGAASSSAAGFRGGLMSPSHSLLAHADDASTSESAMTFELVSALGFPVYVGVAEFTSPEPDVIILPHGVMASLGITEGSEVSVSRVNLNAAQTIVLQPHSTTFHAVEEFTGVQPREFLEESLVSYSCLQAGDTILCCGGQATAPPDVIINEDTTPTAALAGDPGVGTFTIRPPPTVFRFNVVSVKPSGTNNAVALFAGFQSQVNIEFLPAMDEFEVPPDTQQQQQQQYGGVGGGGGGTPAVGQYRPEADSAAAVSASASGNGHGSLGMLPTATRTAAALGGSGHTLSTSLGASSSPSKVHHAPMTGIAQAQVAYDPAAAMLGHSHSASPMTPMVPLGTGTTGSGGQALGSAGAGQSLGGGAAAGSATASSSNPLAAVAAEREARRKQMAEAAARRAGTGGGGGGPP